VADGGDVSALPGMGDLPERTASTPPAGGAGTKASPRSADGRRKAGRKKGAKQPAETLPVARVAVDMSLPHLDRPFDYLVPASLDASAVVGCRVRVRFAGQLVHGFLLERVERSDHEGRLAYLERVISPEPVLTPEIAALARELADRYAGTLADILRLAVPPRHARVEAENTAELPAAGTATARVAGAVEVVEATMPEAAEIAPGGSVAAGSAAERPSEVGTAPVPGAGAVSGGSVAGGSAGGRRSEVGTAPVPGAEPAPGDSVAGSSAGRHSSDVGTAPAGVARAAGAVFGRSVADDSAGGHPSEVGSVPADVAADVPGVAEAVPGGSVADGTAGGHPAVAGEVPADVVTVVPKAAEAVPDGSGAGCSPDGSPPVTGAASADARPVVGEESAGGPSSDGRRSGGTIGGGPGVAGERLVGGRPSSVRAPSADEPMAEDGRSSLVGAPSGEERSPLPAKASAGGQPSVAAEGSAGGRSSVAAAGSARGRSTVAAAGFARGRSSVVAEGSAGGRSSVGGGESVGERPAEEQAEEEAPVEVGPWETYPAGPSFLQALRAGRAPRAAWSALPGTDWTPAVARAVRAVLAGGRGALVIVADGRDVARVDAALTGELGPGRHVALTAELGPAERYRRWLAVRRGRARAVVGTRAAMFAPVRDLGLVVLWDDGDDVHAEPHAPYPHAREVLALRAHRTGAGALIGGFTRTTDTTQLVSAGWARPLVPDRERLRAAMAHIRPSGDDADLARDEAARSARLPHVAFRTARQGLEHGPVLVQVPRRGYVPALACARCRGPARCPECEGPLSLRSSHAAPYCRWCGRIAGDWRCPECGGRQVRAVVVGARRTAEELGRAFPGVPIRTSGRDGVLAEVTAEPALVVATPGAEPVAEGGYAAALLLDGWVLLGRADLRAGEEALRRWMNATALVRPRGPVVVLADGSLTPVQALIRWDAVTFAERELAERRELGFPPAVRMASLTGTPQSVRELVEAAGLPGDAEVLGPVDVGEGQERALVRVDRARGAELSRLLKAAQAARSTRRTPDVVRVRVDPLELI
jgi:primosomal protein N' (replication factor Y) (superfamily II helicase)